LAVSILSSKHLGRPSVAWGHVGPIRGIGCCALHSVGSSKAIGTSLLKRKVYPSRDFHLEQTGYSESSGAKGLLFELVPYSE
jgi:hypothetical protein